MIVLTKIRHDCPEKEGFTLTRPNGHEDYTFLHFLSPVEILLNGEIHQVKAGAVVIYAPKTPQYYKAHGCLLHNWFHAKGDIKEVLVALDLPQNTVFYPEAKLTSEHFQRIEYEFFSSSKEKDILTDALLREYLCLLSRGNTSKATVSQSHFDTMRSIRQKILLQPEKHFSAKELASIAGLSTSRFHSVYRKIFGTSPIKDIISAHIEYTKSLLLTENLSVSEISEKAGYNDQYHFIRQFKKETGISPAKYRKSEQKK